MNKRLVENPQDVVHNPLYALRSEEERFCWKEHARHSGEIAEQAECLPKLIFMGVIWDEICKTLFLQNHKECKTLRSSFPVDLAME